MILTRFFRENQQKNVYWWMYCIRLENLGEATVKVRGRHQRLYSLSGRMETVRGLGVDGQEPVLSRDKPAFQYSSHVSLQAPSGHMWLVLGYMFWTLILLAFISRGTFRMERKDGYTFDCRIPPFSLES